MTVKIPKKIGHRGAAGHAPENTLAGIRKAADLGACWVEFDVMLSQDGIPILMHDNTLNRTTNGKGPISAQTLNVLRTLDAGSWFNERFAGEPIPTLAETLRLAEMLGLGCNVEIKPSPETSEETAKAVIEVVNSFQRPFSIIMSSFSETVIEMLHTYLFDTPRGLLVNKIPEDWRSKLQKWDCFSLHCNHKHLSQEQAKTIKSANYHLLCYTVNEPESAASLFNWGVDAIFSDYPDRV
ncbi:MAG: glycerophosphodiester phosphodiesterase [Rhodospirillaceae bacterium]|nr:glycerophosphodiester phosphodiesterase [Rhodospirillaceae bacterium]|tara:strand:- start:587 stop:1303 length:717 start_codon:yes stop_codon:yes gene_type:complete